MDKMRNLPIEDFYNELDMIYKDKPLNKWGYATAIKRINDTPIHFDDYIALMLVLKGGYDRLKPSTKATGQIWIESKMPMIYCIFSMVRKYA